LKKYQISVKGKKKFKRTLSCLFGGRQKVQVTKFAVFVVGSAANSVGSTLEFTVFGSGPEAKPSRASAFCFFFCPQPWFLRRSEHIFPRLEFSLINPTV